MGAGAAPTSSSSWSDVPRGTTLRNIRIDDDLWRAARQVAQDRGETLSEVIRAALRRYIARHTRKA